MHRIITTYLPTRSILSTMNRISSRAKFLQRRGARNDIEAVYGATCITLTNNEDMAGPRRHRMTTMSVIPHHP
ncbi:hypothetical protein J1614_001442 [Plenodomus biglobosus]|nr:hypothetical protein J1614_001442 [Plenodomus biglobosus]